jgi:hypothetical protein
MQRTVIALSLAVMVTGAAATFAQRPWRTSC